MGAEFAPAVRLVLNPSCIRSVPVDTGASALENTHATLAPCHPVRAAWNGGSDRVGARPDAARLWHRLRHRRRPGNAPCRLADPTEQSHTYGRGGVAYDYRIGRTEITTAQWIQFANTFETLGGQWTNFAEPTFWGAEPDPNYTGPGQRWVVSDTTGAGNYPVGGISWRTAAMYCNWLCNGQSPSTTALQNGAYDASTFTTNSNNTYNDQLAHNPGARFWIPTLDEWLKAAHYDPNRNGPGQVGWWMYPNRSDTQMIYGPPPGGQANAGAYNFPYGWYTPLGSYPGQTSAFGLLDAAGEAREWVEEPWFAGGSLPANRVLMGSTYAELSQYAEFDDRATQLSTESPWIGSSDEGLRIASPVSCYPNCDASTTPPILNVQDFTCFLQKFTAGDLYANCDGSTAPPVLNVQDFTCFLQQFAQGCP